MAGYYWKGVADPVTALRCEALEAPIDTRPNSLLKNMKHSVSRKAAKNAKRIRTLIVIWPSANAKHFNLWIWQNQKLKSSFFAVLCEPCDFTVGLLLVICLRYDILALLIQLVGSTGDQGWRQIP